MVCEQAEALIKIDERIIAIQEELMELAEMRENIIESIKTGKPAN